MNPLTEYWIQIYRQAAREDGLSPETAEALFRQVDVLRAELTRVTAARHKADAQAGALARELAEVKELEAKYEASVKANAEMKVLNTNLAHELNQTRAEAGAEVERVHAKLAEVKAQLDISQRHDEVASADAIRLAAELAGVKGINATLRADIVHGNWDAVKLLTQCVDLGKDRDRLAAELTLETEMRHRAEDAAAEAGAELAGVKAANQVLGNQVTSLVEELRGAKEAAASANTAQLRAFEGKDRYREDVAKLTAALAHIKVVVEDRMTEYYPHTALNQILKTVRGIAP